MTAAASPPDPSRPRRVLAGVTLVAALGALVATVMLSGCGKPPDRVDGGGDGPATTKGDPWKVASARLKKGTDYATCKSALGGLSADTGAQEGKKLPALSAEALAPLAALVHLTPADRDEIGGAPFTAHDAGYLADCFYLRDAARALGVAGLPPERQADLAFAWVCRQVYPHPWLRPVGRDQNGREFIEPTALPPVAVLRRGYGSGLERMYVFLALAQQLELDACLIGGPDAGTTEARTNKEPIIAYPDSGAKAPRGPFWAVGVRVGTDVRLFDPWRGSAFPVTLNQLRANPDAAKAWFEDKANTSAVTLDEAKKATAYLALPVNALSPRMAAFEANLKGDLGVKVAFDPKAFQARFADPKPAFWGANGPFDYGRAARTYFPADLGGHDRGAAGTRLFDYARIQQLPASAFMLPAALDRPDAKDRLRAFAAGGLDLAFLEPPNPRERIQRGQYHEAARDVVDKQGRFAGGLERLRANKDADKQIEEWIAGANAVYTDLGLAQLKMNAQAEAAAMQAVENHWKAPGAQFIIDRASAEVGQAEASFLLALCKHEEAEAAQVRSERAAGPEAARLKAEATGAWETALSSWRTYEQNAGAHAGFPGRAAHGRKLMTRAAALAAEKK